MFRAAITFVAVLLCAVCTASAADYRYVKQDRMKEWIQSGKKMIIVDIQVAGEFEKRHLKGSVETNAYPVKTEAEKARLEGVLRKIRETGDDIVIVCPRGGGGAKNTYDHLKGAGVDENRLYILEKGMEGWSDDASCAVGR